MRALALTGLIVAMTAAAAGGQVISEFMAVNNTTLADVDGDFHDWIEIWNPGTVAIDLGGWYLTDDAVNRTRWQFPSITLEADAYLLVFASSKDYTDPRGELHTNFRLRSTGEYLGLIMPDGSTAAHEYSPAYPPQIPDVPYSYGLWPADGSVVVFDILTPGTANVPEPGILALLALGGLAMRRRRNR